MSKKPNLETLKIIYNKIKNNETNFVQVGRYYGVSDNAVRKWFKTEGFPPIKKNKPSVLVICNYCGKQYKQEYNRVKYNREHNQNNYCSKSCQMKAQKERGIQGRLSQKEFEFLYYKKGMGIRAIARKYGVAHTQIIAHYQYSPR